MAKTRDYYIVNSIRTSVDRCIYSGEGQRLRVHGTCTIRPREKKRMSWLPPANAPRHLPRTGQSWFPIHVQPKLRHAKIFSDQLVHYQRISATISMTKVLEIF